MTSAVYLANPGLIPIEAITTMGINAKECDNPIGFFGTGLKYAIACLLRNGHRITIWRGLERYDFSAQRDLVRGKEFEFVCMAEAPGDPVRLGFTTHLGSKWEMWQVFRELYSNCLDEDGELGFAPVDPVEGWTLVRVEGEAFAEAARKRDRYFLTGQPIYKGTLVEVYRGPSEGLYYRGVLASALSRPSVHTYNITTAIDLTEDRTIKHRWMADSYVNHMLAHCGEKAILEPVLVAGDCYEDSFEFADPCAAFAEFVLGLCERRGVAGINQHAVKRAEEWAQREARVPAAPLTAYESAEVESAKAFLVQIGYPVSAPIIVAETLGPDVFGMAKDGRIYLAKVTVSRGGNFLIGTLLEEHLHLTHGFSDATRRFQDFLIDLVVRFAKEAEFNRRAAESIEDRERIERWQDGAQ